MSDAELSFLIDEITNRLYKHIDNMIQLYLKTHLENGIAVQSDSSIITVSELADLLKVSKPIAYELVNAEGFPSFKIGRNIRVDKKLLALWLEKQTVQEKGLEE